MYKDYFLYRNSAIASLTLWQSSFSSFTSFWFHFLSSGNNARKSVALNTSSENLSPQGLTTLNRQPSPIRSFCLTNILPHSVLLIFSLTWLQRSKSWLTHCSTSFMYRVLYASILSSLRRFFVCQTEKAMESNKASIGPIICQIFTVSLYHKKGAPMIKAKNDLLPCGGRSGKQRNGFR